MQQKHYSLSHSLLFMSNMIRGKTSQLNVCLIQKVSLQIYYTLYFNATMFGVLLTIYKHVLYIELSLFICRNEVVKPKIILSVTI